MTRPPDASSRELGRPIGYHSQASPPPSSLDLSPLLPMAPLLRRPGEPDRWYLAFLSFFALSKRRSIQKTFSLLTGKKFPERPTRHWYRASKVWGWRARVREADALRRALKASGRPVTLEKMASQVGPKLFLAWHEEAAALNRKQSDIASGRVRDKTWELLVIFRELWADPVAMPMFKKLMESGPTT